jgi:type II secretory pathway pseudopilin PulG
MFLAKQFFVFGLVVSVLGGGVFAAREARAQSDAGLAFDNCQEEARLRSVESTDRASVTFMNSSSRAIKIFWLDYQGKRRFYHQLGPRANYRQTTYLSHPWVITDDQDKCLHVSLPAAAEITVELTDSLLEPADGAVDRRRRVALVIGNSDYKNAVLKNPTVDADLVSAMLRNAGFDVTEVKNADFAAFDSALTQFAQKEEHADIALFYFAGHGFALKGDDLRPRNYLMSTSADIAAKSDALLRRDGMTIDEIIDRISGPAKVTIAFVDACRNDPFHRGSGDRAFEPIAVPLSRQIYIGMSSQIGKTALDGDSGDGSPFTRAFVENMATPGLRIDDAFRALRSEVSRLTEGRQQPEVLQDDLNEGATMLMKAP